MSEGTLASLRNGLPRKDDGQILSFQMDGYIIQVGQNSYSNERLVKDHPHRDCLWLHAMAARGSHVVLCLKDKEEPAEEIIQYAAKLALNFSHSEAKTVSVAILKDIYKPEGFGVGVFKSMKSVPVEVL